MKTYKFKAFWEIPDANKYLNRKIKQGWKLEKWEVNNSKIIMLLSKEN